MTAKFEQTLISYMWTNFDKKWTC